VYTVLMPRISGQLLILAGLLLILPSAVLFSTVQVELPYWVRLHSPGWKGCLTPSDQAMLFPALILLPGPDLSYVVASVQISLSVDPKLQSMAGSLFQLATRLATSMGLAVSSTLANSITRRAEKQGVPYEDALLQGYKAAGFLTVGSVVVSILLAVFCCRGMGLVGQSQADAALVELPDRPAGSRAET
jgi:hypothetical protein